MTDGTHPLLPAATPLLRWGRDGLQVGGADGGPGLRLGPVPPATAAALVRWLRSLDGSRTTRAVLSHARAVGLPDGLVDDVLRGLRAGGLLAEPSAGDLLASDRGPAGRARTALELPMALRTGGVGGWRGRRAAAVVVEGATRVGVPLAAVLAASGVGRVHVRDRGTVGPDDCMVGGLAANDEGRPRALAAAAAVRRVAPQADLRPLPADRLPDLLVLCHPWAALDPLQESVHRAGTAHLVATVRGDTGVVGPLVVPGATSCLRCAEAIRRDDASGWSQLAAQLREVVVPRTGPQPGPATGSTATCLATAVTAAGQVLAHLDGVAAPASLGAVLELRAPDLLPHRRRWPAHPECPCGAAAAPQAPGGEVTEPI